MANNKIVYGNSTLIDLTSDTVTADKLLDGYTAHDKAGNSITGTLIPQSTIVSAVGLTTPSLQNKTITVKNDSGTTIATTTFNASGYAFVPIPSAGTYTFTVTY